MGLLLDHFIISIIIQDHNAVVWPLEHLLKEDGSNVSIGFLSGHKCSVWAVSTIPSRLPKFLTGSADKTIKMWSRDYEVISEFIGTFKTFFLIDYFRSH